MQPSLPSVFVARGAILRGARIHAAAVSVASLAAVWQGHSAEAQPGGRPRSLRSLDAAR